MELSPVSSPPRFSSACQCVRAHAGSGATRGLTTFAFAARWFVWIHRCRPLHLGGASLGPDLLNITCLAWELSSSLFFLSKKKSHEEEELPAWQQHFSATPHRAAAQEA